MDASLARLLWALPLVLVIGVAAIWALKRWLHLLERAPGAAAPLSLKQSLSLSDRATAHVLEVEGRRFVVVESAQAISTVELGAPRPLAAWPLRPRGMR